MQDDKISLQPPHATNMASEQAVLSPDATHMTSKHAVQPACHQMPLTWQAVQQCCQQLPLILITADNSGQRFTSLMNKWNLMNWSREVYDFSWNGWLFRDQWLIWKLGKSCSLAARVSQYTVLSSKQAQWGEYRRSLAHTGAVWRIQAQSGTSLQLENVVLLLLSST